MRAMSLPKYCDLPVVENAPTGSSWGVWGSEDELGTLNLLDDDRTLAAAAAVQHGAVYPLQLPLEEPAPGVVWRGRPRHHLLRVGHERRGGAPGGVDDPDSGLVDRDDYVDGLWLQGSSQWDGLTHIRHAEHGNYNGIRDDEIHPGEGTRLGIDRWANRGVVGRGLVVDVVRYLASIGESLDPMSCREVTPDELDAALDRQGSAIEPGDILLVHTGWLAHLLDIPASDRGPLLDARAQRVPGLEVSDRILEWCWDHHLAAVAADNVGVEACGPGKRFALHPAFLALLGMPLGEYWWLHDLAAACATDGRHECLLVSVPLNLRGAVGSPAQAVAIR